MGMFDFLGLGGGQPKPQAAEPDMKKLLGYLSLMQASNALMQPTPTKQNLLQRLGNAASQGMSGYVGGLQEMSEQELLNKYKQKSMDYMDAQIGQMGRPKEASIDDQIKLQTFAQTQADRQRDEGLRPALQSLMGGEGQGFKYPDSTSTQQAIMQLLGESPALTKEAMGFQKANKPGEVGNNLSDTQLYSVMVNSDNEAERKRAADMLAFRRAGAGEVYGATTARRRAESETAYPIEYNKGMGKAQAEISTVAQVEAEKGKGEMEAKFREYAPKARNAMGSLEQQWDLVEKEIDRAISRTTPLTTGIGALAAALPGSPQMELAASLDTIKANIGFDKLQDMRQNSPTGGALGQVSDFENRLLQAVKGKLEQKRQSGELKKTLAAIKADLQNLRQQKRKAFEEDYGKFLSGNPTKSGKYDLPAGFTRVP